MKKGLKGRKAEKGSSFSAELKTGWDALTGKKGILTLVVMGALITFCLGVDVYKRQVLLARDVSKRIEDELEYPGQIKVNVIRESRVTDYAK